MGKCVKKLHFLISDNTYCKDARLNPLYGEPVSNNEIQ